VGEGDILERLGRIEQQTSSIFKKLYNGLDDKIDGLNSSVKDLREEVSELRRDLRTVKLLLIALILLQLIGAGAKLVTVLAQMNNAQIIHISP
jgi:hypothetical protein